MKLSIYQIDAFATKPFEGNPAAVVPLHEWLTDNVMQSIAEENNLSETAFFVASGRGYEIRWFTPRGEVKLCGHATLASAFVLFNELGYPSDTVEFESLSGRLSVSKNNQLLTLNFPSQPPVKCEMPELLANGLGRMPVECLRNEDFIAVFETEEDVASIIPDFGCLERLELRGVVVTSPALEYDFVARFFAPKLGVPEDPVTGSAYTQLAPYWSVKQGKNRLKARQISRRGGNLFCEVVQDRVLISGNAIKYLKGDIEIII